MDLGSLKPAVDACIESRDRVAIKLYKPDFLRKAFREGTDYMDLQKAYRSMGLPMPELPFAVLVQRYVVKEKAGVLFTADPLSQNREHMTLSVADGPNANVTAGNIAASYYVITRYGDVVKAKEVYQTSTNQIKDGEETLVELPEPKFIRLSITELKRITEFGRRVEEAQGYPQDIEFLMSGSEITLLQSRSITGLDSE